MNNMYNILEEIAISTLEECKKIKVFLEKQIEIKERSKKPFNIKSSTDEKKNLPIS